MHVRCDAIGGDDWIETLSDEVSNVGVPIGGVGGVDEEKECLEDKESGHGVKIVK